MNRLTSKALTLTLVASVMAFTGHAQADQFDPWQHLSPSIRHAINVMMNYQLRALGYEGTQGVPAIDEDQYTVLHDRYFCFLNLIVPRSRGDFERTQEEFGELIQAGRDPCEGYLKDGGMFVNDSGEVRFRGYSRKPTSPLIKP